MSRLYLDREWTKRLLLMAAVGVVLALVLAPGRALAAEGGQQINFFLLAMNLFGGLAIFLYGMEKMSNALKVVKIESSVLNEDTRYLHTPGHEFGPYAHHTLP